MFRKLSLLLPILVFVWSLHLSAGEVSVEADLSKTGETIHPFVYGQFIEHMGRCIYGGIWAEMLEDRKFYFPITEEYNPYGEAKGQEYPVVSASPWEIVGNLDGVVMVKEGSFVGEHTPLITGGSGIRQKDLGVKAGRNYAGYFWAKSKSAELTVRFGSGEGRRSESFNIRGDKYRKFEFEFLATEDSDDTEFELQIDRGQVLLGTVSIMPSDNIRGMRADTIALLKELNAPIYRWPGGNFVSGYEWRDGIGDRDRRPPRRNPAWTGVEHNDFGTDEFIAFCREINTEPAIAVNTGFGDPHSAAEWVAYCNDASKSHAAEMRKQNGNVKPFEVKYWCVGNEMFGTWQLGHMQLHHYTEKHNRTARAMWEVDDSLTLIGVGAIGGINADHDPQAAKANRGWSRGMLESSSNYMSWISEHFYDGRTPWTEGGEKPILEHVELMKNNIRKIVTQHRELQPTVTQLNGQKMPIAMDEWNYWHRDYQYGELGCVYDLGDALGIASGLHEYFRQSDMIAMANYAQTVNVIGCIKTSRTEAEFATTGLVLKLYREVFGSIPLTMKADTPHYDICAAMTEDRRYLTVGIVNPTSEDLTVKLALDGGLLSSVADHYLLTGPNRASRNQPGFPREVDLSVSRNISVAQGFIVPPLSNSIFVVSLN